MVYSAPGGIVLPARSTPRARADRARAGLLASMFLVLAASAALVGPFAGAHGTPASTGRPIYVNVTAAAGLGGFLHGGYTGNSDPEFLGPGPFFPEIIGPGACWLDADLDGDLDLYLVSGIHMRFPEKNAVQDPHSRLYINTGGSFAEASPATGTQLRGSYQGCAAADYDDDGDADLYVTAWGGGSLLRNDGGIFTNVTAAAGVDDRDCGDFRCWGSSVTWWDYDRDGCLDLFINHFGDYDDANPGPNGPEHAEGQKNRLFRSLCDGTFADRTDAAGMTRRANSWASIAADYDRDGWPDLYVANDGDESDYYTNDHDGTFTRRTNALADPQHGMGLAVGDHNHDGLWDIVKTNYVNEFNNVFRGTGSDWVDKGSEEPFTDALPNSGWATHWFDLNNDGHQDFMVVNGMTEATLYIPLREPMLLYENTGAGFQVVRDDLGDDLQQLLVGRGGAWADYDDDGDVDVLVTEAGEAPTHLYRADRTGGNFLNIDVVGTASTVPRDAPGTRIKVTAAGLEPQFQQKALGSGFLSSNDPRFHVGLGAAESAGVEVTWPDGSVQTFTGLRANRFVRLVQGDATVQVLRELPLVRILGPATGQRLESLAFEAQTTVDGASVASVVWAFGDGATATGASVTHAFTDVDRFVVSVTVTDTLGRAKTQAMAVLVTDALQASVEPAKPVFLPLERAAGAVVVRFSDGAPVRGAEVRMTIAYGTGIPALDALMVQMPRFVQDLAGYTTLEVQGTTGADGRFAYLAPYTFVSPAPAAPFQFNHPGRYTGHATGGARGSFFEAAEGTWQVGVVALPDP